MRKRKKQPLVLVRMSQDRDIEAIADLHIECFEVPKRSLRWFHRRLVDPDFLCLCYVAVLAGTGKIIGYVITDAATPYSRVIEIVVSPMYRGQGHGRRLLEQLIIEAPLELVGLSTKVPELNQNALMFFKHTGFTRSWLDGDVVRFERDLLRV